MKTLFLSVICIIILSNSIAQQKNKNFNAMIKAEYSFIKSASEIGTRDAFLKYISDDGILFRPNPVNGKKFLSDSPKSIGLLSWYPVHAKIASDGEMGFTTGPAEYRKDRDSTAVWFGNFCTVWQKQLNGEWKFVIDMGNQNEKPLTKTRGLEYKNGTEDQQQMIKRKKLTSSFELYILDRAFNSMTEKMGIEKSYKKFVNNESRLLRDGFYPIIGVKEISNYLSGHSYIMRFKPLGGKISSSKDLGFTYGELEIKRGESNVNGRYNYLRVYQRIGKRWIITTEVVNKREK